MTGQNSHPVIPFSASCFLASSLFSSRDNLMPRIISGAFVYWDIAIFNHFDSVGPWIKEIKKVSFQKLCSSRKGKLTHSRSVIYDEAEVPILVRMRRFILHQRNELITH